MNVTASREARQETHGIGATALHLDGGGDVMGRSDEVREVLVASGGRAGLALPRVVGGAGGRRAAAPIGRHAPPIACPIGGHSLRHPQTAADSQNNCVFVH